MSELTPNQIRDIARAIQDGFPESSERLEDYADWVEAERRWIPCSDARPESSEPVLVYRPSGAGYNRYVGVARFSAGEWINDEYHGPWAITHWLPLPIPPKGSGE